MPQSQRRRIRCHFAAASAVEEECLAGQVEEWRREVAAILGLADEPKDNTIEVLRKSDLEVGLEALLGQEPRRRRRRRQS